MKELVNGYTTPYTSAEIPPAGAGFGVRLRGNDWFQRSPLHRCAAPLRMTQRVWRIVEYNLFVAMLLYLTDSYCTTHATISPLCHFRANAYGVPSNPEGAPAGGISALVYGLIAERIPLSTGGEAARCNNFPPPKQTKTSPESTRPCIANQIFALLGRVLLGEVRGG